MPITIHSAALAHRLPQLLLIVAVLALAACHGGDDDGTSKASAPVQIISMQLERKPWRDGIEALGTARANESVVIAAKVNETVKRVNFDSGDYVEAGAVLVDLSGRVELAELEEARAQFREAQQQLERNQQLAARQLIPASQIDTQRAARDATRARMDAIRARLADRVITAPFDGVLGLRQVSPGTLLRPGDPITTLDDVSLIKLDFTVPESFIAVLKEGLQVQARSAAWPDKDFVGVVRSVDSRVDPVTRAVTVRAEIPNIERKLRPGMLMTVLVQQEPRQALVLPELALIQIGRQAFVFRVRDDNTVEQVPVNIGARRRGDVEISNGLSIGDRVVVEGTVKLRPGASVVEHAPAPATPALPAAADSQRG
ncbi:MAG: efflux RND transporter periplasmic adaptor subunit [Xanthomonadaceae bacterium]|nr:efflux RND transporter periplasmic adaptor subunit [Xanthomonadaceae bacterium]MDP2186061.1 efflux RND transporter periplasmic adaptor subunit [Xanthomonadales bacterium]MDZ4116483.1 efflux RND transporter periplasmic adaptor subunit [Xanthomonadaceae bacterium]MDZ4377071.1 efflux RND transporter periplasmic adaptor subunit [Xanthomonadaceae bacterium]